LPTYFGRTTQTGTDNQNADMIWWTTVSFACPGSGSQNIQELSAYCYIFLSTPHVRLGVYNSGGTTLIAEGTGSVAITGAALAWQGHMTQASVKAAGGASPGVLVGGTSYVLALTEDSSGGINFGNSAGTTNLVNGTSYLAGMPASLPGSPINAGSIYCIRCGVDPAVTIPDTPISPRTTVSIVP